MRWFLLRYTCRDSTLALRCSVKLGSEHHPDVHSLPCRFESLSLNDKNKHHLFEVICIRCACRDSTLALRCSVRHGSERPPDVHSLPCRFESPMVERHKKHHRKGGVFYGALAGTRTPDLLLRRQLLYPPELQTHIKLERVMGIEPTQPAWKAGILPLNYTRIATLILALHSCFVKI